MILIKTNNPVYDKNLTALFTADFPAPDAQAVVLHLPQNEIDSFFQTPPDVPVVVLGASHPEADAELTLPLNAADLKNTVRRLIDKHQNTPSFETPAFIFTGTTRRLTAKSTQQTIRLTEKETALLVYLYQQSPRLVSKEELLQQVWGYHPNSETHTVETHIYALRQKIGPEANALIQSSVEGYTLLL